MHAETVQILVEQANLEHEVALGIAAAIDVAMSHADIISVPILDTRFATSDAKIQSRFAKSDANIETRFGALRSELKVDIASLKAELKAEIANTKSELVRWVFLAMLGNVALTAGVTVIMKHL